ncbi:MAG TPA: inorganic phosphate transporter [Acidimicrobiales bacterium]
MELWLAVAMALAYAVTTGFHNGANANAALVATRVARPAQAMALTSVFCLLGPLVGGTLVANVVAGLIRVDPGVTVAVLGAGLTGATLWNAFTWRVGIPSSAGHALIGGLVGAAVVQGGWKAVYWGGLDGWKPVGVIGFALALTISPILGFALGLGIDRAARVGLARATRRVRRPVRGGEWVTSASLAFANGSNDGAKAAGIIAALLVAAGRTSSLTLPMWVRLSSAVALTVGTAVGGWALVNTIGRRLYRIRPLDGLVAQASSTGVVVASSLVGAPVSTTQVLASSVVGIGVGRRRFRHINWVIVRTILLTWITTLPASAALAAASLLIWRP